ncbi:MAG: Rv3235 family protein [Mycobacteriales bacterium]
MTLAALATVPAYPRVRPVPRIEPPFDDEQAPRLRILPPHVEDLLPFEPHQQALTAGDGFDRMPTSRADLGDPRPWAGRLILATLEALAGRRPVQQLMPWTDDAVYAQISRTVRRRAVRTVPGAIRSLHIGEPADGIAEVCAVVSGAGRTRAVAARLEGSDGRWRCTALRLL